MRWADGARQVLRDDVPQQCGFSGAGHAQHDALHDAHMVRPIPRLSVNVITEDDCIPFPSLSDDALILFPRNNNWSMGPLPFLPRITRRPEDCGAYETEC